MFVEIEGQGGHSVPKQIACSEVQLKVDEAYQKLQDGGSFNPHLEQR